MVRPNSALNFCDALRRAEERPMEGSVWLTMFENMILSYEEST